MPDDDPVRVLVVGTTGRVGRHVAFGLQGAGVSTVAGVTTLRRRRVDELGGVRRVHLDLGRPWTWPAALDGVDRVFLIRPPHITDMAELAPFLHALAERHVRHVVFLSVRGVNPLMPHWRVERELRRLELPTSLLRATDFMQNLEGPYLPELRDLSRILVPAGRGRTAFVDTRDVAALGVQLLQGAPPKREAVLTCTGPQALTGGDVASILSDVLGREVRYQPTRLLAYRRQLRRAGEPAALLNVQTAIHLAARAGLAAGISPDMPMMLGRPATTFRQYAMDAQDAWLS